MSEQIFNLTPFVGGLNTEYSTVEDLPQCTSDELNCTIYAEGVRGRRLGMDLDRDGSYSPVTQIPNKMVSAFLWKNVNKTGRDFIVIVDGHNVMLWQAVNKPYSRNPIKWSTDLSESTLSVEDYITDAEFYNHLVNFSIGDGKLMMVNPYMKPLLLSYDEIKDTFTFEEIKLRIRDFDGLEDGVKPGDKKGTLTNDHKYNLLNQGWRITEIEQFYNDKKYYPDNTFRWFIGKDDSGKFNTDKMLQTYFGNTPAPKGHFILDYFNRDRADASGIYLASARSGSIYLAYWEVRNGGFNNIVGRPKAGIHETIITLSGSAGTVKSAEIRIKKNICIAGKRLTANYHGNITFTIQGLNSSGKWVTIGTDSNYFYGAGTFTMSTQNNTTKYKQHRLVTTLPNTDGAHAGDYPGSMELDMNVKMSLAEDGDPFPHTVSQKRVADIAYMSNKYFYLTGNTVLFSQTITDSNKGYGNCYQDADPTSEDISDLLETDGGCIKFETMGDGVALRTFNRGVLVFGRDVVWGLISPADGVFTATAYDIVELSKAGICGPHSAVSVADSVYYWSPLGIFQIGVNAQTGSTLVAQNITQTTIQTYYNNIPLSSKALCRGVFDYVNNRIYWYYPTDAENPSKLDGCLMYDLNYGAFMPFKIADGTEIDYKTERKYYKDSKDMVAVFETVTANEVEPSMFLYAGDDRVVTEDNYVSAVEPTSKYNRQTAIQHVVRRHITDHFYNGQSLINWTQYGFCDYNSRECIDWGHASYDSYMVSRPIMWESLSRYSKVISSTDSDKQVPVLQTLFKRTEEDYTTVKGKYIAQSGAYIRLRWGWSLSDKSNRWDMVQNAYRPQKDFMEHEYVESRMHVRGRGKSFQVEVRNDGNKDFRLAAINLKVRSK